MRQKNPICENASTAKNLWQNIDTVATINPTQENISSVCVNTTTLVTSLVAMCRLFFQPILLE